MGNLLSFHNKLNFRFHFFCPSADILFHRFFEIRKAADRIMEVHNCLVQCFGRIIRQHALEIPKGNRAVIKVLLCFHFVITECIFNKNIHPPTFIPAIQIVFPVLCRYHIQRLPVRIPIRGNDFLSQESSYIHYIFHKLFRVFKNAVIHFLQNVFFTPAPFQAAGNPERIIDMSAPKRDNFCHLPFHLKL